MASHTPWAGLSTSATPASAGNQGASVPVTGEQYALSAGDYRAVVTGLGAGLRELSRRGTPVLSGYEPDESPPGAAGQLLVPWPNRVDHGRYHFGGADHQLDLSEAGKGNAIHGLTRFTAWVPVRHEPASVVLKHLPHGYAGYPFCLEIDAEYRLTPDTGLHVTISATNRGTRAAPYGFGQHPYLTAGATALDEWELTLPATRWLPVDSAESLRARQRTSRAPMRFPVAAADWRRRSRSRNDEPGAGKRWPGLGAPPLRRRPALTLGREDCPWLQVFTSDTLPGDRHRKAVAIEPMSCPPNAFVTGDSLIVLSPGETVTHHWGIQAHQV